MDNETETETALAKFIDLCGSLHSAGEFEDHVIGALDCYALAQCVRRVRLGGEPDAAYWAYMTAAKKEWNSNAECA